MRYTIIVDGRLDQSWESWFDGLSIVPAADGKSQLTGMVADQAALYGILRRINHLGLTLISVNPEMNG